MGVIRNVKRVKKLVDKGQKLMNQYSEYVEKNEDEEPSIIPKSLPSPSKTKNESTSSAKIRFCENCGQKIRNGASFCSGCGTRVVLGCNEVKRSASDNKQEDIEVPTEKPKKTRKETNTVESLEKRYGKAGTDERKIRIVQSFVIPKEEEELLRLVAVCEEHIPNSELSAKQRESYDVETAWMKKLEQICERTRRTMPGSSISSTIESVYQDRLLVYQANNGKGRKLLCWIQKNSTGLMLLGLFVIALLLIILPVKSLSRKSDAEAKRFDSDVAKVQEKINEGDYQGALRRANALTTTNSKQKQKKQELINSIAQMQESKEGFIVFPAIANETNYSDAQTKLELAGFTNVSVEKIDIKGIDKYIQMIDDYLDGIKAGSVVEISVNGSKQYFDGANHDDGENIVGTYVVPDAKIVIRYK